MKCSCHHFKYEETLNQRREAAGPKIHDNLAKHLAKFPSFSFLIEGLCSFLWASGSACQIVLLQNTVAE